MHNFATYLISLLAFSSLTIGSLSSAPEITTIGAILDQTSRPGKEAKVAIEIATQDFNIKTNHPSRLYLQNSRNKPGHAAIAAKELIDEHRVKAVLGAHTWEEASAIAEVISEADRDIPVFLSLAGTTLPQATRQWPFFIQAVPTQSTQMNAITAILQSWGIRQVTLIYETSHPASSTASIISHLSQAFRQTGSELNHILPLTSGSYVLDEELEILKRQHKVFVMHTSLELGVRLFQAAKKMEMTGDGYLWIPTNGITDLFYSFNSTMTSSLKGMVGVKSYFPENTPEFQDFRKSFRQKFRTDYPGEEHDEPGIFAVQGYNAVKLLEKNLPENFHHRRPLPESTIEIINVMAKGYHSVYWTEGTGFGETVDGDINRATAYTHSKDNLGQALCPVQPWYAHRRRRNLAESSWDRMCVGVPGRVEFDPEKNQTKKFDEIRGDVTIVSSRHYYADFTHPYTESGLEMIVPIRSRLSNQSWLFIKPFAAKMWLLTAAYTLCYGYIIWLIERSSRSRTPGDRGHRRMAPKTLKKKKMNKRIKKTEQVYVKHR